ncbi:MAG: hypothetical protein QW468_02965 [Candidatus Bathyarchaeia archaeon]
MVLYGKRDILVPPESGSILAKAIPNAELVYLRTLPTGFRKMVDKVASVLLGLLTKF